MNGKKTAVIFAGGDLGSCCDREAVLRRADLIIAADCGLRHTETLGAAPDIIVGDFDSYRDSLPETEAEIYRSVPEKDDTDTIMAVRIAIEKGCREIDLYGALGGSRFDHAVANVQTLLFARERGCGMRICGDEVLLVQGAEEGTVSYQRCPGYFSVFALTDKAVISELSGVRYPLRDYTMTPAYPIGVSNEITSDHAELRLDSGIVLVVMTNR